MQYFTGEEPRNKSVIVLAPNVEWQTIMDDMSEYCKNHKRKVKAKKLLKQMEDYLVIY